MKRDMDVIRRIALAVYDATDPVTKVPDVPQTDYLINAQYLIEAGLAEGEVRKSGVSQVIPAHVSLRRLTWDGQDFVSASRDVNKWQMAKEKFLNGSASFTFEIFKEWLKGQVL